MIISHIILSLYDTLKKMFSVKLLVRGERFCVWWVGGGGEDGLKVLISKSTA